MKAYIFLLVLNCTSYFLQAQSSTIDSASFYESYAIWQEKKKSSNNSYRMVLQQNSFSGWIGETTITVKKGVIVKRTYREKHFNAPKGWRAKRWKEKGTQIGKHKEEGVAPILLDQIYNHAKNYLPRPQPKVETQPEAKDGESELDIPKISLRNLFTVYFSVDKEGIISLIGSRHNDCMDDCFQGYRIKEVKWLD